MYKIEESSTQMSTIMWSFSESPSALRVPVINIKRVK